MTADELLRSAPLDGGATYTGNQGGNVCVIDPETREIQLPIGGLLLGVESDEKVERIAFQCPKIVGDGIDLSALTIRINYKNANGEVDRLDAENIQVQDETITFDWVLSRKVTKYKGDVNFIVCAVKLTEDVITNEWNTTLAQATVLEGLEVEYTESEEEAMRDLLAQSLLEIDARAQDQEKAIEQKGKDTLATIPEDYDSLDQDVKGIKTELTNAHIGWDGTEYPTAGDAVRGQIKSVCDDLLDEVTNAPWAMLEENLVRGFDVKIGSTVQITANQYQNGQINLIDNVYYDGIPLQAGNYFVLIDADLSDLSLASDIFQFTIRLVDGWSKTYSIESGSGSSQTFSSPGRCVVYGTVNFTNENNLKCAPQLVISGITEGSTADIKVNNIVILSSPTSITPEIIDFYGYAPFYPVFNYPWQNYSGFVQAYIKNGALVANETPSAGNNKACYTSARMPSRVSTVKAKVKFHGTASCALISDDNGYSSVLDVTNSSVHIVFGVDHVSIGHFDNKELTNTIVYNYSSQVEENTEYSIGYTLDENAKTLIVYLPDGTTYNVGANFGETEIEKYIAVNGNYCLWEHYISISDTVPFQCVEITKIWCEDSKGNVLCDDFDRNDGFIGYSPQGYIYGQFSSLNQIGWEL